MHVHTHAMLGWLISQPLTERRDRCLVTAASVLPDLDGIGLILGTEYFERFHHTFGHSILTGAPLALSLAMWAMKKPATALFLVLGFLLHILTDLLGSGSDWPIQLLWPLNRTEYAFSPPLQWELASWQNFLVTGLCIGGIIRIGVVRGRTIAEVVSTRIDLSVVSALRSRLGRRS